MSEPDFLPEKFAAVHVWRADPFRTRRAPINGYYAVGAYAPVYLRTGERFPPELCR